MCKGVGGVRFSSRNTLDSCLLCWATPRMENRSLPISTQRITSLTSYFIACAGFALPAKQMLAQETLPMHASALKTRVPQCLYDMGRGTRSEPYRGSFCSDTLSHDLTCCSALEWPPNHRAALGLVLPSVPSLMCLALPCYMPEQLSTTIPRRLAPRPAFPVPPPLHLTCPPPSGMARTYRFLHQNLKTAERCCLFSNSTGFEPCCFFRMVQDLPGFCLLQQIAVNVIHGCRVLLCSCRCRCRSCCWPRRCCNWRCRCWPVNMDSAS